MEPMNASGLFFRSRLAAFATAAVLAILSLSPAFGAETDADSIEEADRREEMRGTMRVETEQSPDGSTTSRLRISVDVPKTDVYLNGAYEGAAPVDIDGIKPGTWRVALKKRGYYTESFLVRVRPGETRDIRVELMEITGYISLSGAPKGASFEIDGTTYDAPLVRVGEGTHTLIVRAFGYEEQTHAVAVFRERETKVDAALSPAVFSATALAPSKRAFNPANPGRLAFAFRVTAPGSGALKIRDESGAVVRTIPTGEYATWLQSVPWDGTDESGAPLPDGRYNATLETWPSTSGSDAGSDGSPNAGSPEQKIELETSVEIDGSIRYPWASAFRGSGSIGPIILATLTPTKDGLAHFTVEREGSSTLAGFAALYGITRDLEAAGRLSVVLEDDDGASARERIQGGLALKYGRSSGNFSGAIELGYDSEEGITLGPAAEFRISRFSLGGSASLTVGDGTHVFSEPALSVGAGAFARVFFGPVSAGLWAFAGSTSFAGTGSTEDFNPTERLSFGTAVHLIIPSTNLAVSAEVGWEKNGSRDGIGARAGFGILF